ncbi:unnamed protein product [Staurois parvus]|uniref:Myb/SANT-like DNA-binding domain-containing protein n=1 Tax=Staurois parvus TaxID=386267 RepID=A0ABN9AA25_9NEOB|nr:unnamed protein product [Staurois parvus]
MMENRPPLTSPDGSSNRNPPERRSRPLYSRNYREHDDNISHCNKGTNQIQAEVKEEIGELYVKGDEPYKEEEFSPEIITAGPSNRSTPRYSSHPYSRDSSLEDQKNLQDYQGEDFFNIKVEVKEEAEEICEKSNRSCKEEIPPEISPDGHYLRNNWEKRPIISPEGELEDDGAFDSSEDNPNTPNVHPVFQNADLSSDPSTSGRSFPDHSPPATHHTLHRGLFKRRAAQMGKSSTRAGTSGRKRALASAALSSEDDDDEAGPPKKLGGGLRNIRFSHEENCVLVHTVIENWTSLYGALSQKISFAQKKYLWQVVVSAVNAVSHYGRTVHHCKKRLSDIKR